LHFAITGKTAAEIIAYRVSSEKPNMGLTSWRKSHQGKIMPSEVAMALASKEYAMFNKQQDKDYLSDFDKEVQRIQRLGEEKN
jgi:hypothetical protein